VTSTEDGAPSSSSGVCHDPDHPDQVYDCDAPPHYFPGDYAAYAAAMTDCLAQHGWHVQMTGAAITAPADLSDQRTDGFNADAASCLATVGLYSIANASDDEITAAYRQLHQQWTCLKEQKLPAQPFPTDAAARVGPVPPHARLHPRSAGRIAGS